jgi:hypothetical protein
LPARKAIAKNTEADIADARQLRLRDLVLRQGSRWRGRVLEQRIDRATHLHRAPGVVDAQDESAHRATIARARLVEVLVVREPEPHLARVRGNRERADDIECPVGTPIALRHLCLQRDFVAHFPAETRRQRFEHDETGARALQRLQVFRRSEVLVAHTEEASRLRRNDEHAVALLAIEAEQELRPHHFRHARNLLDSFRVRNGQWRLAEPRIREQPVEPLPLHRGSKRRVDAFEQTEQEESDGEGGHRERRACGSPPQPRPDQGKIFHRGGMLSGERVRASTDLEGSRLPGGYRFGSRSKAARRS